MSEQQDLNPTVAEDATSPLNREFEWVLGDDYDCETCGSTYNRATFNLDHNGWGQWYLYYAVGCYGGDGTDNPDELETIFTSLREYPDWSASHEALIIAKVTELEAQTTDTP